MPIAFSFAVQRFDAFIMLVIGEGVVFALEQAGAGDGRSTVLLPESMYVLTAAAITAKYFTASPVRNEDHAWHGFPGGHLWTRCKGAFHYSVVLGPLVLGLSFMAGITPYMSSLALQNSVNRDWARVCYAVSASLSSMCVTCIAACHPNNSLSWITVLVEVALYGIVILSAVYMSSDLAILGTTCACIWMAVLTQSSVGLLTDCICGNDSSKMKHRRVFIHGVYGHIKQHKSCETQTTGDPGLGGPIYGPYAAATSSKGGSRPGCLGLLLIDTV